MNRYIYAGPPATTIPCEGCEYNNKIKCGKDFCILPKCIKVNAEQENNCFAVDCKRKKGGAGQ